MTFNVKTLRAAERDFNKILTYLAARSKSGAIAWAKAFDKALSHLESNAESCPLAAEDEFVDFELREIMFKTRRGLIYRILFSVRENEVMILHVRGPGQDLLASIEIRDPD